MGDVSDYAEDIFKAYSTHAGGGGGVNVTANYRTNAAVLPWYALNDNQGTT